MEWNLSNIFFVFNSERTRRCRSKLLRWLAIFWCSRFPSKRVKHFLKELWSQFCQIDPDRKVKKNVLSFFRLCQRYDIIQKLLWAAMSHLSIDRIEVPIGLVAQLSYYQECEKFPSKMREKKPRNSLFDFSRSKNDLSDVDGRRSRKKREERTELGLWFCDFEVMSILLECSLWKQR